MVSALLPSRPGFAITEVAAVLVVSAVGLALLVAAGATGRQQARLARDQSNLRDIAALTTSYGAANDDRFWGFSWVPHQPMPTTFPDLRMATSATDAAANQAVDIIRRVGQDPNLPRITGWIAQVRFSQLALAEFAGLGLPTPMFVSSLDANLRNWSEDPAGFRVNRYSPCQPTPTGTNSRWMYASSYEIPVAWFDLATVSGARISNNTTHSTYLVPGNAVLGRPMLADVRYPASKVMLFDGASRGVHRREVYFMDDSAKNTVLMADGSAGVRASSDANRGWQPNTPSVPSGLQISYQPQCWEPPTTSGQSSQPLYCKYRFTRQGLAGRDFGGPEIQ